MCDAHVCVGVDVWVRVCGTCVCLGVVVYTRGWRPEADMGVYLDHFTFLVESESFTGARLPASGLTSELEGLFPSVKRYSNL